MTVLISNHLKLMLKRINHININTRGVKTTKEVRE